MNPTTTSTITESSEFILRRLQDNFPDLALGVPILFALAVLFLILFYRQQESLSSLLKTLFIPAPVLTILHVIWGVWLLLLSGLVLTGVLAQWEMKEGYFFPNLLLYGLPPLLIYPAVLGVLGMVVLCLRSSRNLIALLVVTGISVVYALFGLVFKPTFSWFVILVPVLLIGFVYVGLMYQRDSQSVHWAWASFLGFLRVGVYCILAVVFLLPGCQMFDTSETYSKVLVLFDVSGSMNLVDGLPKPGEDPKLLPSRQDKIIQLLASAQEDRGEAAPDSKESKNSKTIKDSKKQSGEKKVPTALTWMDRVQAKSPVTAYRFGGVVDDSELIQFIKERKWARADMEKWLKPDRTKLEVPREINGKKLTPEEHTALTLKLANLYEELQSGTNISGAALQAVLRESGNLIQAVIIFSDGQNNLGSDDTFRELQIRAANPKRPLHIITVGVGKYRQPVNIRVGELAAPQQARPDDRFPVKAQVFGDGLLNKDFKIHLDITRLVKKGDKLETIPGFKKTLTKDGKFKGTGSSPSDQVDFEVDVRELSGIDPKDDSKDDVVEGYWEFRVRVPRDPLESFPEAEHVSKNPARVLVQKRKLRVLVVAGGANRDYQFVRTLFHREVQEKRMELSIYLQSGAQSDVDQDVEGNRLLNRFPDLLGKTTDEAAFYSLDNYDAVIAFDPDWSRIPPETLQNIKKWVGGPSAGGFVLIADPINSYQLARPGGMDLSAILTILPVTLKDSRLHGLGIGHDPSRPYTLTFPEKANDIPFLRLDDEADLTTQQIWDRFFWSGPRPEGSKDAIPRHGIFNYYPVEKVKPGAMVLATFSGPASARINDGKDEMPYIVTMPYGKGQTVFIGSGELWRLRTYKEAYHQRFFIKLARYAGSGSLDRVNNYGAIYAIAKAPQGVVPIEAQLRGEDLKALPANVQPIVTVVPPAEFDPKLDRDTTLEFKLKAKPTQGEWQGWFNGSFKVRTPGQYTLKVKIPGVPDPLTHDLNIYRPDPELDNLKPNHGFLYQLASDARPLLRRLDEGTRKSLEKVLVPPQAEEGKDPTAEVKEQMRLYFPLEYADLIPDCLVNIPPEKLSTKGRLLDLWDQGFQLFDDVSAFWVLLIVPAVIGLICAGLLALVRQWLFTALVLAAIVLVAGTILSLNAAGVEWTTLKIDMAWVLGTVVALLSIEWLTRKLLRLA